jgi:tRNA A-37 threonylcarbamoyl transferase component Bud32
LPDGARCEQCGETLAGDAPAGLCPKCLLRTAIEYGAGQTLSPMLPHLRYFGDYELLDEIARGGMGVVYRARQVSLDRQVAVKMMRPGLLATETEIQRFRAEARTAASLQHPNIVAIHEVGEFEGLHYFSMDLVKGPSLAALVREKPLGPDEAARHVRTLAEAVEYAHSKGVLHRDLKPSNVLLDPAGRPRITDFGLARPLEGEADAGAKIVGTPAYMPPEQAEGEQELGPASDVYSLGAILYELLTGLPPFRGGQNEIIRQVKEAQPIAPSALNPQVGRELDAICLHCLEKDPAQRYRTAGALAAALERNDHAAPGRRPALALAAIAVSALAALALFVLRTEKRAAVAVVAQQSAVVRTTRLPVTAPPVAANTEKPRPSGSGRAAKRQVGAPFPATPAPAPATTVVPTKPAAISVFPQGGSGGQQVFRFRYSDDIGAAEISVHDASRACAVFAEVNGRVSLEARPEGSPGLRVSGDAGSLSTLENGVCTIDLSGVGFHKEDGGMELTLPLAFKPSFAGIKEVVTWPWDKDEKRRGIAAARGNWTVEK